ncbi:MAG: hypothetical protein PHD95_05855 [Candidatus ainarchaeum sp.]|nr:hypothetical protein [Candidatus ainarchaeum sp.]
MPKVVRKARQRIGTALENWSKNRLDRQQQKVNSLRSQLAIAKKQTQGAIFSESRLGETEAMSNPDFAQKAQAHHKKVGRAEQKAHQMLKRMKDRRKGWMEGAIRKIKGTE